jgi:hypothetical protein
MIIEVLADVLPTTVVGVGIFGGLLLGIIISLCSDDDFGMQACRSFVARDMR